MKQILLDSSFIISATKAKIDIFEELQEYQVIVPEQVIDEIFRITQSKQSLKNREAAKLALKILETCSSKFKKINISQGKKQHTDKLIIKHAKENPSLIVATLDKEIKSKLKGRVMIIRQRNKFEIA